MKENFLTLNLSRLYVVLFKLSCLFRNIFKNCNCRKSILVLKNYMLAPKYKQVKTWAKSLLLYVVIKGSRRSGTGPDPSRWWMHNSKFSVTLRSDYFIRQREYYYIVFSGIFQDFHRLGMHLLRQMYYSSIGLAVAKLNFVRLPSVVAVQSRQRQGSTSSGQR